MVVRNNNPVPISKFKKNTHVHGVSKFIKVRFNVPAKRAQRKEQRLRKAAAFFPRPIKRLRPLVHSPSVRHSMRLRLGKGFTEEELKLAGIPLKFAPTIGIAVDKRRQNRSEESLNLNAQRLKEYKSKLVLFPLNPKKLRKGPIPEATPEQLKNLTQLKGVVLPQAKKEDKPVFEEITPEMKKKSAWKAVRNARIAAKAVGYLIKKKMEEEAAASKKKGAEDEEATE